jgi:hypothetical protein
MHPNRRKILVCCGICRSGSLILILRENKMRCQIQLGVFFLAFCLARLVLADSAPLLPATLIGPHPVGMRLEQQYDYSRFSRPAFDIVSGQASSGPRVRPIQTLVWYPAQAADKSSAKTSDMPMQYSDYARTTITQQQYAFPLAEYQKLLDAALAQETRGMSKNEAQAELQRPMLAVRDRKPLAGKFPLVIYAPRVRWRSTR